MSRMTLSLMAFSMMLVTLLPGNATAGIIDFRLLDHPDGNVAPPPYALRLDGLFTGDSGDIYTFEAQDLHLIVDTSAPSAHITGTVFGGLNAGTGYATDGTEDENSLAGLWEVDFLYDDGVAIAIENSALYGDRLVVTVDVDADNDGTFTLLDAIDVDDIDGDDDATTGTDQDKIINLVDFMGFIFRADLHRLRTDATANFGDFPPYGVGNSSVNHCETGPLDEMCSRWSGRGWLNHGVQFGAEAHNDQHNHISASDFIFTGQVPEPGTALLLGLGLAGLGFAIRGSINKTS